MVVSHLKDKRSVFKVVVWMARGLRNGDGRAVAVAEYFGARDNTVHFEGCSMAGEAARTRPFPYEAELLRERGNNVLSHAQV